jgi:hypothetical protein
LAFVDEASARLESESTSLKLFEAELLNPEPIEYLSGMDADDVEFWNGDTTLAVMRAPRGTVACDAVRLVKEVSGERF